MSKLKDHASGNDSATFIEAGHRSPDGNYIWDGQEWIAVRQPVARAASKGLSSWADGLDRGTSEDLFHGQTVIVWARWILIGTGLLLSFWNARDLPVLEVQLAAIITLAFGNFYLHVQLLRGRPAIDVIVYAASAADLAVITALVVVQGGFSSPVFIFYFAAALGFSVAFPTPLAAAYSVVGIATYGVICLATSPVSDEPAIFTRMLMIAAISVCGNLFARNERHRRAEAVRLHEEVLAEMQTGKAGEPDTAPVTTA